MMDTQNRYDVPYSAASSCIQSIIRKNDGSEVFRASPSRRPEGELSRDLVLD
ncbi:MAG: hypothetical protein LBR47_03170 [Spirochaetaceae bacterium]|jgi:hypothetical protein|nr:hypothetical protein [Spirochaetaceae bacterium]